MFRTEIAPVTLTSSRLGVIQPGRGRAPRAIAVMVLAVLALVSALDACIARAQNDPAWAIGLPGGHVTLEHQASAIIVSAEDAARGVVEMCGGSGLVVTTHAPSSYMVDLYTRGTVFQPTAIGGIGVVVELNPRGGTVANARLPVAASSRSTTALPSLRALPLAPTPDRWNWQCAAPSQSISSIGYGTAMT